MQSKLDALVHRLLESMRVDDVFNRLVVGLSDGGMNLIKRFLLQHNIVPWFGSLYGVFIHAAIERVKHAVRNITYAKSRDDQNRAQE